MDRVAGCRINIGEITMTVDDAIIYAEQKPGLTVDDALDFLEMVLDSEDFQQWLRGLEAYAKSVKAAAGLNWGWSIAAIPNSQS